MRPMIGFDADKDYLFDAQQKPPLGWCPECGMEIWTPDMSRCTRCTIAARENNLDWEDQDE